MKNAAIIMPIGQPWEWSTDYYEQTARVLAKDNFVLCVQSDTSISIKTICQTKTFPRMLRKINARLYVFQPIDVIPFRRFAFVERANLFLHAYVAKMIIGFIANKTTITQKIVWIFDPPFYYLPSMLGPQYRVVYDVADYMRGAQTTALEQEYLKADRILTRMADVVAVNSQVLQKIYLHDRPDVLVVPQGFRIEAFRRKTPLSRHITIPRDKLIIGYIGGINSRLDFSLLLSLVKRCPRYNFVFSGQLQNNNPAEYQRVVFPKIQKLFSCPNVTYLGNVSKEIIPAVIETFDVCMIPYDLKQPFNKYCYPMKLFEYFYMGKPVISTPIEELKRYPKYVKIGTTVQKWKEHIQLLLSKPWPEPHKRAQRPLAIANSWENKIKIICKIIST